jgi:hypothetical protein
VGEKRERERIGVVGGFGGLDQAVRGGPRLFTTASGRQCNDQASPGDPMGVAATCELGAAPLSSQWLAMASLVGSLVVAGKGGG